MRSALKAREYSANIGWLDGRSTTTMSLGTKSRRFVTYLPSMTDLAIMRLLRF